jgi:periplasmic divalent cation tolerance protein
MTEPAEFCLIMTTCNQQATLDLICKTLLGEKLAACIQVFPVQSHYMWKDGLAMDAEQLLFIKTRDELYEAVRDRLLALHDYETPEIMKLPIMDGSADYLGWVKTVTRE